MRNMFLFAAPAAAMAGTPAIAAQKLGARTQSPEQVLAQMGEESWNAELERAISAASAFPLGSIQNPVRVAVREASGRISPCCAAQTPPRPA